MLTAPLGDAAESGADFHTLDRIDAHHGVGNVGVQPVEHGFTPADRHVFGHYPQAAPMESQLLRMLSM